MARGLTVILLAALLLVGPACQGSPAPARTPAGPIDLVFSPDAGGGINVYSTADGERVAQLPAGAFDARISVGGDLGEAYLVNGDGVSRVRSGRPFSFVRVADVTGSGPWQVALVPAPGLTTYVGERTVLVTLSVDGSLAGYQAGTRIWTRTVPRGSELRRVDDWAALRTGSDWSLVLPVDGRAQALAAACPAGPLGMAGSRVLVPCTTVEPGLQVTGTPAGRPWELRPAAAGGTVLAWPGGAFVKLAERGETGRGRGTGGGRPGVSPDGKIIYWPHDVGGPTATAAATSRDGNFLITLGGGQLTTFAASPRRRLGAWPAMGSDIVLVVGG